MLSNSAAKVFLERERRLRKNKRKKRRRLLREAPMPIPALAPGKRLWCLLELAGAEVERGIDDVCRAADPEIVGDDSAAVFAAVVIELLGELLPPETETGCKVEATAAATNFAGSNFPHTLPKP